ncbi:hypothetical protein CRI70_00320, partial [Streptomyces sp. Ru87]
MPRGHPADEAGSAGETFVHQETTMFEYALHEMRRAELLREAGEHRLAREVAAARRAARSRGGRGGERE